MEEIWKEDLKKKIITAKVKMKKINKKIRKWRTLKNESAWIRQNKDKLKGQTKLKSFYCES